MKFIYDITQLQYQIYRTTTYQRNYDNIAKILINTRPQALLTEELYFCVIKAATVTQGGIA